MADARQRTIIKVFRKYSHSLGPDALELLEEILDRHEIADDQVESSIDQLAKEYNKQDDALMKVSLEILQRVYENVQDEGTRSNENAKQLLDPEAHLFFIDAFEMPLWHWSQERGTFERVTTPLTCSGSPDSRVFKLRDRLNIIKQSVLRNEHFAPSTLPSGDRERLVTLKSTKQLLGRAGERFLLLGMLAHSKEGKLVIEDSDGTVELDYSKLDEPGEGLFTEGSFALVEGEYSEEGTLWIIAIGQPPCETRETARSIYGHIDFLGKGATSLLEDINYAPRVRDELSDVNFFCFSDLWLDRPKTFIGLKNVFDQCIETNFIPKVFILCGNFTSRSIAQGNGRDVQRYQDNFDSLAELIASYPRIIRAAHFVFVPGPLDITVNSALPRRPLQQSFVAKLRSKIPQAYFASNPCRIKFFNQEVVIYRDDCMSRMLRNIVGVKPNVISEDLKKYLVQSILDQGHLTPLTLTVQPTLTDFDHAMRLYPLPTALVLADKYEKYRMTYSGCHVFNPGSFVGREYAWSSYSPASMSSDECVC